MSDLLADPHRIAAYEETGIYVRALLRGTYEAVDIAHLDTPSLQLWLRSRGGNNPLAENVVRLLLSHPPLNEPEGGSHE